MKNVELKCIYCGKTSDESGLMQMTVYAPGTYLQCYDIRKTGKEKYCKENKEFIMPNGEKEKLEIELANN